MGNIFTQRVECAWNELLHTVIAVGTMSIFKGYLDKHMDGMDWKDIGQEKANRNNSVVKLV